MKPEVLNPNEAESSPDDGRDGLLASDDQPSATTSAAGDPRNNDRLLVVSGHDYRSQLKAAIHFITRAGRGYFAEVSFFSIGFSLLSAIKGDGRMTLRQRANRWEQVDGVNCYLWHSLVHPANLHLRFVGPAVAAAYHLYARWPMPALEAAAAEADTIVFESGLSPMFIKRLRRCAPGARFIYVASDLLATIGVHETVARALAAGLDEFDLITVPARNMVPFFAEARARTAFIPHGLDVAELSGPMTSPYTAAQNICSVGSMLFDARYFEAVAPAFPEVQFHVIGAGKPVPALANVHQHAEMPFRRTLPYIRFADAGVAPYLRSAGSDYLADSSLKLRQYAYFGLPAVCPDFAVGDYPHRFGYTPGDAASMIAATRQAIAAGRAPGTAAAIPTWEDVARRMFETPNAKKAECRMP